MSKIISQVAEDPRDEKEIIKDLINCKVCSEKIIARCHTCRWPIYKTDLIYEDSRSVNIGFWFINFTKDLKSIQCDWCWNQWLVENKEAEKWWKEKRWIIWFCEFLLILGLEAFLIYHEFFFASMILFLFISPALFVFSWNAYSVRVWLLKRFKSRSRKAKEKSTKKDRKN